ncbi:MAG TPA: PAS domain-containing protein, partial [Pyrinomonadaceae bacterium]|nr:PAS domain-containing protein [Pyrinomonadaceae bacterium]
MSSALRFFLAMCAVGVAGTAVYVAHDQALGRFVFLVALAGLLLGMFVARGGRREAGEAPRRFVPTYDLSPRAASGHGAAGPVLEATMNAMREGVIVVDSSLRVVSLNRASAHLFGGKEGAAVGRPLSMMTRDPAIHAAYRAALEVGEFKTVKVELSGVGRRVVELHVAPLTLDEEQDSRGAIGVFLDLTELERL